ncbi:UDP-N-acetylmuramoyl-tripeptide--D-alanyl-D-alanine ligase [Spectribacter hydrogenoxidans]|uniref:UDP-N-acetylmuramoyl-tripeptide--D-alanyl-D-alanine ligase n=1 Tax=Spectribacter hydrogenoxidans TaxID=3075608 RepID=A0ABU3BX41_9GAMM|nr:UDP-N-acetylmuramoyl-tripeptide--D-alanyl-D-alanine ligase [Salinisphaera sp. W335]MDT0633871.1 UDP-N-acetylmuramoyl-tripeptide--D-alanyl-D-alanine ligase [Salinisphaera sp. W335]
MKLRLSEVAALVNGRLVGEDAWVEGVSSDTRGLSPGCLFVALRGERYDGHEFVRRAATLAAGAALVAREVDGGPAQIVVGDTLAALQRLAAAWRLRSNAPVLAVTGSNGKTTTKTMLAAILGQAGRVLATRGNLNNHIGVPLTLLELNAEHEFAVVEMGANHPGEIALLTRLARPNVGLITNAGDAHLEGFGSREGVARAKGELFADLAADGIAVINADDAYADLWGELAGDRRQLRFGLRGKTEVSAHDVATEANGMRFVLTAPDGEAAVTLPLAGRHNVANALAAAAAAAAVGTPVAAIAAGLAAVPPVAGRLRARSAVGGATLIDDSYNANPDSLAAAIEVLTAGAGEAWLVLGDMAELGDATEERHTEAGRLARKAGVRRLFTIGRHSALAAAAFGGDARHYDDRGALVRELADGLSSEVTVLVKGSRSAGMEQVVEALTCNDEAEPAGAGVGC